jgi:hypothetical protein
VGSELLENRRSEGHVACLAGVHLKRKNTGDRRIEPLGARDTIHPRSNPWTNAFDLVPIPRAGSKRSHRRVVSRKRCKPTASTFVVHAARPTSRRRVNLNLKPRNRAITLDGTNLDSGIHARAIGRGV